jgi:hypothetical protein
MNSYSLLINQVKSEIRPNKRMARTEVQTASWLQNLKERDNWKDLDLVGIYLKWYLRIYTGFIWFRIGISEHGNESSGSIKFARISSLLKTDSAPGRKAEDPSD